MWLEIFLFKHSRFSNDILDYLDKFERDNTDGFDDGARELVHVVKVKIGHDGLSQAVSFQPCHKTRNIFINYLGHV